MENALAVVKKHLSEDKFSTDIFAREMMAYLFFCVKYERNLAFSYKVVSLPTDKLCSASLNISSTLPNVSSTSLNISSPLLNITIS